MTSKHNTTLSECRMKRRVALAALLLAVAAGTGSVFGLGIALPDQDAFATARGNAFVATANNPSAIFYNPAGISQLEGANVSLGAYGLVYSDRDTGPAGSIDSKTQWEAVPQVFSTFSLPKYNLTFGFGTYSPYGLRMEWPSTAPFVLAGETGQINYLRAAGISLLADHAHPFRRRRDRPELFRGRLEGISGLCQSFSRHAPPMPVIPPEFCCSSRGRALFRIHLSQRDGDELQRSRHVPAPPFSANTAASADFHFPTTLAFGYSYRPG
jgi:hypothetical protein